MYGAEAVILNLSEELHAGGAHQSALGVFAHTGQPQPMLYALAREKGIDAHLVQCRGQVDLSVPNALRALALHTGADVIHAHGYKADLYAGVAWRGRNDVLVSTCHTWYDNDLALRVYGAADRRMLRRFDGVVAVSEEVCSRLLQAGVKAERVRLIRNGVLERQFAVPCANCEAGPGRRDHVRVGLVGRLAPEKAIDLFLQSARAVVSNHPKTQFVIAGDGPDRAALQEQTGQLGLEANVTFAGRQENMPAFYASLDVLASSSRQEGLPVALLEGMASGLPVAATRVGAVPEAVLDGETGLLVPPGDPLALAAALEKLIGAPELRTRFGRAGQQRIHEHFSAARMTADYLSMYAAAIETRTGRPHRGTCTP